MFDDDDLFAPKKEEPKKEVKKEEPKKEEPKKEEPKEVPKEEPKKEEKKPIGGVSVLPKSIFFFFFNYFSERNF